MATKRYGEFIYDFLASDRQKLIHKNVEHQFISNVILVRNGIINHPTRIMHPNRMWHEVIWIGSPEGSEFWSGVFIDFFW